VVEGIAQSIVWQKEEIKERIQKRGIDQKINTSHMGDSMALHEANRLY
jgi:hypothetical protein